MKSPDENPLLKQILADEELADLRNASLSRGLDKMRRARRVRLAMRVGAFGLVPVLLIFALTLRQPIRETASPQPSPGAQQAKIEAARSAESNVKVISDEELFALFPDRSLALIGKPPHQQLVVLDAR